MTGEARRADTGCVDLSPSSLIACLLVGGIGTGLFVYGKKQSRIPHLLAGIALTVFPMFVTSALLVYLTAAVVIGALWYGVRAGIC